MAIHDNQIEIRLHPTKEWKTGNFTREITVSPTACIVAEGQPVVWTLRGSANSFELSFMADGTPFDSAKVGGDVNTPVSKPVTDPNTKKTYHYRVTVSGDDGTYTIPGCPEIIIR